MDKATGLLMGSSRYGNFNPDRREIEIGWTFLGKDYWGKQFNAESKTLMIGHAFTFVDTVLFWVDENKTLTTCSGKVRRPAKAESS